MDKKAHKSEPRPPKKPSRKRRLVMLAVGVGLGVACRFVPPQYQAPCAYVTKLLSIFMGVA